MTGDARAALLQGLVDYAGLFPPAALSLDEALARYDHHLRGPDAAWLGRFVLPAAQRDALGPWLRDTWHAKRPLRLSLLADLAALAHLAVIGTWAAEEPSVRVEALELRPPRQMDVAVWLEDLLVAVQTGPLATCEVYVELAPGGDQETLAALARWQGHHSLPRLGAKLRCGGVTADLVPRIERVAAVIAAARDGAVPLKFTAGLHHPVRGMGRTADVPMHGFLNVYGAGLLAHGQELTAADLEPVLAESDPAAFRLDADAFAWRDRVVPGPLVADMRARLLGSYGSCSFTEPMGDLRALGLLA